MSKGKRGKKSKQKRRKNRNYSANNREAAFERIRSQFTPTKGVAVHEYAALQSDDERKAFLEKMAIEAPTRSRVIIAGSRQLAKKLTISDEEAAQQIVPMLLDVVTSHIQNLEKAFNFTLEKFDFLPEGKFAAYILLQGPRHQKAFLEEIASENFAQTQKIIKQRFRIDTSRISKKSIVTISGKKLRDALNKAFVSTLSDNKTQAPKKI